MRFRFLCPILAAGALLSLAIGGIAAAAAGSRHHVFRGKRSALTATQVRRLSADATKRSIIIFKNQFSNLPARKATAGARASAASAAQAGVRAELKQVRASHVHSFQIINAISATISPAEVKRLQANSSVRAVVPDTFRPFAPLGSGPGPALPAVQGRSFGPAVASAGPPICPSNPAQPLIEPEARP